MAPSWLPFLAAATLPLSAWSQPVAHTSLNARRHDALAKRAAAPTTTPDCSPATQFFTQKLDHSDASNNATWQQQYQIVTDYFQEGGPILLFQGEETTVLTCLESTILLDWAKETNGIAASIEHRYFGQSLPLGSNSLTTAGLEYLTLDNVIADAEEFVSQIKANVSGAANSKVAVASGSYGAFLVTVFKQNSDVFDAGIASAAPLRAFGVDPPSPDRYNWFEWISDSFVNASASAASKIHSALLAFNSTFSSSPSSLVPALSLCAPPPAGVPVEDYLSAFSTIFSRYTEFNYPYADPGRTPIAKPLEALVDAIVKVPEEEPLQVLNESIWQWFGPNGNDLPCFDPLVNLSSGVPLLEQYPFNYIVCTYLPTSAADVPPNGTIFLPGVPFESELPGFCKSQYNLSTIPTGAQLEAQYHFGVEELEKSTGIVWVEGGYDPTAAVSVPASFPAPAQDSTMRSGRLFVQNMAHREDLFAANDADRAEVVALREQEIGVLKTWFGLA